MLLQGTLIADRAAITNIRWSGKFRANVFFIKDTGRGTFAAGPAKPVVVKGTCLTYLLGGALMLESEQAVIKGLAIGSDLFERDVIFYLFGDGCAILV